jgi:hypothetical protein
MKIADLPRRTQTIRGFFGQLAQALPSAVVDLQGGFEYGGIEPGGVFLQFLFEDDAVVVIAQMMLERVGPLDRLSVSRPGIAFEELQDIKKALRLFSPFMKARARRLTERGALCAAGLAFRFFQALENELSPWGKIRPILHEPDSPLDCGKDLRPGSTRRRDRRDRGEDARHFLRRAMLRSPGVLFDLLQCEKHHRLIAVGGEAMRGPLELPLRRDGGGARHRGLRQPQHRPQKLDQGTDVVDGFGWIAAAFGQRFEAPGDLFQYAGELGPRLLIRQKSVGKGVHGDSPNVPQSRALANRKDDRF